MDKKEEFFSELDVLKDIVQKLEKINIPYMLTGSLAMNYYAEPRMTRDLDFIIKIDNNDIQKIISIFESSYYISEEAIKDALFHESSFNIIHNEAVIKVDFILRKNDKYRKKEFSCKKRITIDNMKLYIVSKEDLIISKLIWSLDSKSEKQKNDIHNLLQTSYNKQYLFNWLEKLELISFFKDFIDARYLA